MSFLYIQLSIHAKVQIKTVTNRKYIEKINNKHVRKSGIR